MRNSFHTAFFIALRYLFSPKKHNIINIISGISVLGIMASTAALIIVLSVFNGMQDLVVSNFNRFNPPIKIEIKEGKVFSLENQLFSISDLKNIAGVKTAEPVLSDLVLVTYDEKQMLTTLYGVSDNYPDLSGLAAMTIDGDFDLSTPNHIVFGAGIAGFIGIDLYDYVPAKLYYPKRTKKNFINPMDAFQIDYAVPVGVFASYTPYDEHSVFVPMTLAKALFDYDAEISYIAIYLEEQAPFEKVQKKIAQIVGDDFTVLNQMQQEPLLFKTIKAENLIVYLILAFIFIIAAFNIIGILGMLIIEKKQDISILYTLGASKALLKKVFLMVGAMIGIFGGFLGMCIGLVACLLQQYFEFIMLGNAESYIITAYPVAIVFKDFAVVFCLVAGVSLLTSWLSLQGLKTNYLKNKY
ncbi:MAG: ABC transporter permease [Lentimicrobiaceae bacterium]|nr:ABC transporter permease [Lentimicrobiaceae bacterium]